MAERVTVASRSTHLDPSEDTERWRGPRPAASASSTHLDPSEDTESVFRRLLADMRSSVPPISIRQRILKVRKCQRLYRVIVVPPISIRQRILKGQAARAHPLTATSVPPISIRQRILKAGPSASGSGRARRSTHLDPSEDTERCCTIHRRWWAPCSTHLDPSEDTESVARRHQRLDALGSTHLDPSEDTESHRRIRQPIRFHHVPPISIRQRILKDFDHRPSPPSAQVVPPISIRQRILKEREGPQGLGVRPVFHPSRSVRGY